MQLYNQKFMTEAIKSFWKISYWCSKCFLLSKAFFHFSIISNRLCCVPWPFLNPHWYFDRILSEKVNNGLQIILSKIFETKGKVLIGLQFSLRLFVSFLQTVLIFAVYKDDRNLDDVIASLKNIWKYPAKKSLLSVRIFTAISVSWVTFFGFNFCNSLIIFSFSTTGGKTGGGFYCIFW